MSNIFHEINRGFLILGFTGPLNSGCTYAAKFFEEKINQYITTRAKYGLPQIEREIQVSYRLLQGKKDNLDEIYHNSHEAPILKKHKMRAKNKLLQKK